jgi:hypothetical protein
LSRSGRLLALLQALRCRRRPVTAAALARELQVSERTIYRNLSELRARQSKAKPALAICSVQAFSCTRSCSRRTKRKPSYSGYDMLTSVATTSLPKLRQMPTPRSSGRTPGRADCRDFADGHSRSEGQWLSRR